MYVQYTMRCKKGRFITIIHTDPRDVTWSVFVEASRVFYRTTYCVKSVRIRSFSGPYLWAVSLRIQFKCRKIGPEKTTLWRFSTQMANIISTQNSLNVTLKTKDKRYYNKRVLEIYRKSFSQFVFLN